MRYIKQELFTNHTGKPFKISDPENGVLEHEAMVGEVLHLHLSFYDKNHNLFVMRNQNLTPGEIGAFNRLVEILSQPPQTDNYFQFESEDFRTLKKTVNWVAASTPWWRDTPLIEDLLNKALEKLPSEAVKPSEDVKK